MERGFNVDSISLHIQDISAYLSQLIYTCKPIPMSSVFNCIAFICRNMKSDYKDPILQRDLTYNYCTNQAIPINIRLQACWLQKNAEFIKTLSHRSSKRHQGENPLKRDEIVSGDTLACVSRFVHRVELVTRDRVHAGLTRRLNPGWRMSMVREG